MLGIFEEVELNLKGNRSPYGNMGSVHIDIDGILQGGQLYQFHLIPGQAAQFQQFNREDIAGNFPDPTFLASFEMCDGGDQFLFRLIISKDKNKGKS